MCQISIQIPDAVLYDTHMNQKQAADFARRLVAIGYYIHNHVLKMLYKNVFAFLKILWYYNICRKTRV